MAFDFQPMIDLQFNTWGVAAEYFPQGGPKVAVTLIKRDPEMEGAVLSGGVRMSTDRQATAIAAAVRVKEMGDRQLAKGDVVVVAAHTVAGRTFPETPYEVRQEPRLDSQKYQWLLELTEVRK